jgi:hypothetical protein
MDFMTSLNLLYFLGLLQTLAIYNPLCM